METIQTFSHNSVDSIMHDGIDIVVLINRRGEIQYINALYNLKRSTPVE